MSDMQQRSMGVDLKDITDGFWWVCQPSGKITIGEVWRRPDVDDAYEAARIRFIGDEFDYRLEACLVNGERFDKIGHEPDFKKGAYAKADRLAELRRRYTDMGLDEESVEFVVHHCMSRDVKQEPVLAEARVVNKMGERVGYMVWMDAPGIIGGRMTVGMTSINLREANDRRTA